MKLLRLKLLSEFRGLKEGFEIIFDDAREDDNSILEPLCFVGLNGSGKSNILEVISEIFYYLENYSKSKQSVINHFSTKFGFELEYLIPKIIYNQQITSAQKVIDEDVLFVHIIKKVNKLPIAVHQGKKLDHGATYEVISSYLPTQVIGYSSGMNELMSNPYIKMDFNYLQEFGRLSDEKSSIGSLDINRMFFMDYDLNKLITVCNFLFDEKIDDSNLGVKNIGPLKREIKLEELHSFNIDIRLRKEDKTPIPLPSELNLAIDKLQKCATISSKKSNKTSKGEYDEYTLSYWINKETKKAFKHHFKTAYELFRGLYFLRLLNNHLVGGDTQRDVLNADMGTNISAMLPKHEAKKKLFHITNIAFKKNGVKDPVYYEQLSDGEHQFLHVIGAMILLDRDGVLFLLDEPETHFNPEWRSQFVSILNECMETKEKRKEQEVMLTTHSPFIVSDCKPEKVFRFFRDPKTHKVDFEQPKFNTYGASINKITSKLFKKKETISNLVLEEFKDIKKLFDNEELSKEEAKLELARFGESIEKMLMEKYFDGEAKK